MRRTVITVVIAVVVGSVAVASGSAPVGASTRTPNCSVTVDNPHFSKGAGGVIAKVRYLCTGNTNGALQIDAYIEGHSPREYGPYAPDASNTLGTSVGPGSKGTVYVPREEESGLRCRVKYWYSAWAASTLTMAGQTIARTARSSYVHPKKCL
jgi:hypothetical protein